jgi:arylsulfatase A
MVRYLDRNVGKLLARLDALGLREQTLVIFMGDNGTSPQITSMMNGRPVRGDKAGHLDTAIHVPLIASWKGTISPGQVRDDLVEALDVFATVFEAGGVTVPNVRQDGVSLYPMLTRGAPSPRQWIFTDFYRQRTPGPDTQRNDGGIAGAPARYVHDARFKLHANGEFFDYVADPLEQRPLSEAARSPKAQSAYRTLRDVLTRMEAEVKRWDSRRLDEPLQRSPNPNAGRGGPGRGRGRGGPGQPDPK